MAEEGSGGSFLTDAHASDVFFAADVECVLHKYRRWYKCFPRIKPFYGKSITFSHLRLVMIRL